MTFVDPTLTITIDRSSLSLDPLEMNATSNPNGLVIMGYTEPQRQARITYAPDSAFVDGSVALAAAWQQSMLPFDVRPDHVETETQARSLIAELAAAIGQFSFLTTVTVSDGPAEVWTCDRGSMTSPARGLIDLRNHSLVWSVTLPCQPIPGSP